MDSIPHKYPFLFIDRVLKIKKYDYILTIKNITISEYFFSGHFPENPIVPGVLIVEFLAQTAGILSNKSLGIKSIIPSFLLSHIQNAKFKKKIYPGDQLYIEVFLKKIKMNIWKFSGKAFVCGKIVCISNFFCVKYDKQKNIYK